MPNTRKRVFVMTFIRNLLPKQDLFKLFAVTAFPIHFWAYVAWLRDFQIIAKRTDAWDALGVGAYASVYAFFESVVIFLAIYLLFIIVVLIWRVISRSDGPHFEFVIPQLSAGILALAVVAIVERFQAIYKIPIADSLWNAAMLVLLVLLVFLSTVLIRRKDKVRRAMVWFINSVVVLSSLYLFLDFVALVLVIIRQFWKPA